MLKVHLLAEARHSRHNSSIKLPLLLESPEQHSISPSPSHHSGLFTSGVALQKPVLPSSFSCILPTLDPFAFYYQPIKKPPAGWHVVFSQSGEGEDSEAEEGRNAVPVLSSVLHPWTVAQDTRVTLSLSYDMSVHTCTHTHIHYNQLFWVFLTLCLYI